MKKYYRRTFLNKTKGTASIEISFDSNYGDIKITDCNRSASLSINISDKEEKLNSVYKLDKLILELTAFQEKLKLHE